MGGEGSALIKRSNLNIDVSHNLQEGEGLHSKNRDDPICMFTNKLSQVTLAYTGFFFFFKEREKRTRLFWLDIRVNKRKKERISDGLAIVKTNFISCQYM